MKIAVWHNLPSGGGKRALHYFVRGLVERGHQLACWSLDTADHSYLPLSEFVSERIISSGTNGRTRKRFTDKWRPNVNKAVDHMSAFDQACQRCAREIEAGDFDLLFANSALLIFANVALALVGSMALLVGAGIAALSLLYSCAPWFGKSTPIVASVNHLMGGALHFLLGYTLIRAVDARGLMISLFFGLVFAGGHLNQEVRDYEADLLNGIALVP